MMRIFAVMAIINGAVFLIWGISLLANPDATINWDDMVTKNSWPKAQIAIIGFMAIAVGILLLLVRPFRPDLGQYPWSRKGRLDEKNRKP
jgi:uncharacterized protein YjeT (DUF2065 family)